MERFRSFLLNKHIIQEKKVPYYISWVSQLYKFCKKEPGKDISDDDLDRFMKHLNRSCEEWQIKQAKEAIDLYRFAVLRPKSPETGRDINGDGSWRRAAEEMVRILRLKHRSLSTEKTYLSWLRQFCSYNNGAAPHELDQKHLKDFLSYLAVDRKVSAATQTQAFNALLFFYRYVLEKNIDNLRNTIRAKRKKNLPVVLTKQEVHRLFEHLKSTNLLMAQLIYGCGLRLRECMRLRVKDIDFEQNYLTVRAGAREIRTV